MSEISMAQNSAQAQGSMFDRIGTRLNELNFGQKALGIIGIAVLVLGGVALYYFASQPRMTPVYTNLDPADASAIVEQMRTDGVPYELTAGGTTVMVPEDQVYEARIQAASAGLPNSSRGGYGLLDDMGVTSSDFQQSVTYKRAIEGELAGTIESLDAVQTASVALAIPEETVFSDAPEEATASVFVRTSPGVAFTNSQVHSVSHMVAAAVDGLQPENVAVVDGNGELLAGVGANAVRGASGAASDYEDRVATAVVSMLDTVVGRGNSTVSVNAAMSQESSELLEEVFEQAEGAPPLTETTNTEEYTGTGGGAGGVLGPDNIAVPGQGGEGTYTSEQTELQNAVNKVTQTTNIPAGLLNRQTVSVAVDQEAAAGVDVPMLTAMITEAVGLDEERGDALNVSLVPFSTADADAAAEALAAAEAAAAEEQRAEQLRQAITWGAVALAAMIALVIFMIAANRRRKRREEGQLMDLGEAFEPQGLPAGSAARQAEAVPPAPQPPAVAAGLFPTEELGQVPPPSPEDEQHRAEAQRSAQRRSELNAMAAEDPAAMAAHLRALMDQETARL